VSRFPNSDHYYPTGLGAGMEWAPEKKAIVLYDFEATDHGELSITAGQIITIIKEDPEGWWEAENVEKKRGLIPANYVEWKH
jgi:hypothetical protein